MTIRLTSNSAGRFRARTEGIGPERSNSSASATTSAKSEPSPGCSRSYHAMADSTSRAAALWTLTTRLTRASVGGESSLSTRRDRRIPQSRRRSLSTDAEFRHSRPRPHPDRPARRGSRSDREQGSRVPLRSIREPVFERLPEWSATCGRSFGTTERRRIAHHSLWWLHADAERVLPEPSE